MGLRDRISSDELGYGGRLLGRGSPRQPSALDLVREKLASLQKWLREHAAELSAMDKAFVWISSGKTTLGDRQRRLLTLLGLRQVGRFFKIPSEFTI